MLANACPGVQSVTYLMLHVMVSPFMALCKQSVACLIVPGLLNCAILSVLKVSTECLKGGCEKHCSVPEVPFPATKASLQP